MMPTPSGRNLTVAAVLAALLGVGPAGAGEAKKPPAPAAAPAAPKAPASPAASAPVAAPSAKKLQAEKEEAKKEEKGPKKLAEMDLAELQAFQHFIYSPGGRDPMTFRNRKVEFAPREEGVQTTSKAGTVSAGDPMLLLPDIITRVRTLLLAQEYDEALKACGAFHDDVTKKVRKLPQEGENQQLWQRFLELEKTAKRLKLMQDTRKEFESLKLEVKGIQWTPRGSAALINDRIYEAGEPLDLKGKAEILVELIEEGGVVFQYKGQRFRKPVGRPLDEEAPAAGAEPAERKAGGKGK